MAWHKPSNLAEWLDILFRHQKKFLFAALSVAAVVVLVSHTFEHEYTARVVMDIRSDPVARELENRGGTAQRQRTELQNMVQHDVRTRRALLQVISDVDTLNQLVPRDPDGNPTREGLQKQEELIARIGRGIHFRILTRNDDVMRVQVSSTDTDGALASEVVNALVDNYIETSNAWVDKALKSTKEFYERQRDLYAQMMGKSEAERIQFMSDNPGLDPNDPASVDDRLDSLEARLNALSQEILVLEAERGAAKRFVEEQPETIVNKVDEMNPELVPLHERRAKLAARYHEFKSRPGRPRESHPTLQRWAREIEEIDAQIRQTTQTIAVDKDPVPNVERIRALRALEEKSAKIVALQKQRSELEQQHLIYEVRKRKFLQLRERFVQITRRIDEHRTQYAFWNSRLREANVNLQAAIDRRGIALTVLTRPPEVMHPSWPTVGHIAMMALVFGLGAGAAMIVLAELLDRSIHSIQHAADELKLPVLGTIDEIITRDVSFRRKVFTWGVYPAIFLVLVAVLGGSFSVLNARLRDSSNWLLDMLPL